MAAMTKLAEHYRLLLGLGASGEAPDVSLSLVCNLAMKRAAACRDARRLGHNGNIGIGILHRA